MLPTVFVVIGGGFWAMGYALLIPLGTILHGLLPLRMTRSPLPLMFGRAIGHMKMGRYEAAERAALEELEKNPEDYEGWMLLAELYAERFQDLVLADQTIRDLCDQPVCSGIQISLAFHRLADWQLKLGEDPRAARSALEGIIQRLPETHFARMALQRIGQLPADRDELRERKRARPLRLPALKDPLDDDAEGGLDRSSMTKSEAVERANRLVERLRVDPNAPEPREELAHLMAGPLDRVDAALEQVQLLLGMPVRPPEKVPEWLALMAAWHLHRRNDREAARPFLEELVRGHPQAPQAFAARRRLNVMDLHQRVKGG